MTTPDHGSAGASQGSSQKSQKSADNPDFLRKSSIGVSVVGVILVGPFSLYDLFVGKYPVGIFGSLIAILCAYNTYLCLKNQYSLKLNLYYMAPVIGAGAIIALHTLGFKGVFWAFPAVLNFYFVLPLKFARGANILFVLLMLPVAYINLDPAVFARFSVVLIGTTVFAYLTLREIYAQHYQLHELSTTDALTGLHNRLLLKESLQEAIDLHAREKAAMTILMLDLDHFKTVNDQFGHEVGDDVLKGLAKLMRDSFRQTDKVFRLGGEEFLVLLKNADVGVGEGIAERLREKVQKRGFITDHQVTISIGVCELRSEVKWKDWVKRCDENLYTAKHSGRNTVVAC